MAIGLDGLVELVQQLRTVAREEEDAAHARSCSPLSGSAHGLGLQHAGYQFTLLGLCARRLRIQALKLVLDFRAGSFGGVDQCRIKFS